MKILQNKLTAITTIYYKCYMLEKSQLTDKICVRLGLHEKSTAAYNISSLLRLQLDRKKKSKKRSTAQPKIEQT